MVVKVKDIQPGDLLGDDRLWYKAEGGTHFDAVEALYWCVIQWADGGRGTRYWDASDGDLELPLWEGYVPEFLRG